jgi:hypothetical protein
MLARSSLLLSNILSFAPFENVSLVTTLTLLIGILAVCSKDL